MQKYIKKDLSEIRYFNTDAVVENWVDLKQYRLMTDEEILKHETPKPSDFHDYWNGVNWLDPRTEAEIIEYERSLLPRLTKRQFALQLHSVAVGETTLYKQVLVLIAQDEIAQIEYDSVAYVERLSPLVILMSQALGLSAEQIDQMWQEALML